MGTGDYICVTLRGGAPWGFTLREGEGDTHRPFLISQVEDGGRAFLAGVQEGDEVVSLNGEPCADLTLLRAFALIETSTDCMQLLLKRKIDELQKERRRTVRPITLQHLCVMTNGPCTRSLVLPTAVKSS
uniref:Synaptopodin 2 n=1 Tax=Scophthalmus maximus TaxID=52904 RepID=A0A8D3C9A5_SCOMX